MSEIGDRTPRTVCLQAEPKTVVVRARGVPRSRRKGAQGRSRSASASEALPEIADPAGLVLGVVSVWLGFDPPVGPRPVGRVFLRVMPTSAQVCFQSLDP